MNTKDFKIENDNDLYIAPDKALTGREKRRKKRQGKPKRKLFGQY